MYFLTSLTHQLGLWEVQGEGTAENGGAWVSCWYQWRGRTVSWMDPWSNPDRHLFCSSVLIFTLLWIQLCAGQFIFCWLQLLHYNWSETKKKRVLSNSDDSEWESEFSTNWQTRAWIKMQFIKKWRKKKTGKVFCCINMFNSLCKLLLVKPMQLLQ